MSIASGHKPPATTCSGSSTTRVSKAGRANFTDISNHARQYTEILCRRWLTTGYISGNWWIVSCPWREDKNPSLIINLYSGRWRDCAREDRGDLIDLYARLFKTDVYRAAWHIARATNYPEFETLHEPK